MDSNWKWPDIDYIDKYQGFLVHSAKWDDSFSFEGKRVGVIGSGSSAIQIVPVIQKGKAYVSLGTPWKLLICRVKLEAKELVSFIRSPTWITPEFASEFAPRGREFAFTEDDKVNWESDPTSFLKLRKAYESNSNRFFDLQYKDSSMQKEMFDKFSNEMRQRLGNKIDVASVIIPSFAVGCRRYATHYNCATCRANTVNL